jgi:hypothetical protein
VRRLEQPVEVAAFEPSGAGLVLQLLAGLGIDACAAAGPAPRAAEGRVIVCLDNPLVAARSRAAREGMSVRDALRDWESHHGELRARTPPHRRLVVHGDSLQHDAGAEAERLARWLGVRASAELLAKAAAEVGASLRTRRATPEELVAGGPPESLLGLYLDLCAEAGPVYHRALAAEVSRERVGVLGPTQRDGVRSELGVSELMARLEAELAALPRQRR